MAEEDEAILVVDLSCMGCLVSNSDALKWWTVERSIHKKTIPRASPVTMSIFVCVTDK